MDTDEITIDQSELLNTSTETIQQYDTEMETDMEKTESETEHTDNGFEIRPTSARNSKKPGQYKQMADGRKPKQTEKECQSCKNRIKDTQKFKKEIMETNSRCKAMEQLVTEYEREIDTITAECKKLDWERKEAKKTITYMSKQIIEKDQMLQKAQKNDNRNKRPNERKYPTTR